MSNELKLADSQGETIDVSAQELHGLMSRLIQAFDNIKLHKPGFKWSDFFTFEKKCYQMLKNITVRENYHNETRTVLRKEFGLIQKMCGVEPTERVTITTINSFLDILEAE